jgi:restriction system protein
MTIIKRSTIHQVAVEVLKSKGFSLTVKEIFDEIILNDLYQFKAENPLDVLNKVIRKHCDGIDFPSANKKKYFQLTNDRKYWIVGVAVPGQTKEDKKIDDKLKKDSLTLKSTVQSLKDIHHKYYAAFKQQILNQLQEIAPNQFEVFSKRLLEVYGFKKMKVTNYVKDGGIDGFGELKVGITHLNQSKRWKNHSVSRIEIDKFRGAIQGEYEQGIIFTTSKFTKEALKATRRPGAVPIILIDGESIVDIMIEKRFGIEFENIPVFINALDNVLGEND